jgi:kynurenine formamidase
MSDASQDAASARAGQPARDPAPASAAGESGGVTLYDLSDRISNDTSDFEPNPHRITYISHQEALAAVTRYGLRPEFFAPGHAWAVENVTLSTHSGTHIDAPYHYGPTSGGAPARTIDQLPLRWFYSDGVRLDMRHKPAGSGITAEDIQAALGRIGYQIKPFDIVLIWTGASEHFGEPGYDMCHAGLRASATRWLVEAGVKVIGIDAWGLDRPFDVMAQEAATGDNAQFWESHFYGTEREYCQIERLAHLNQLPRPFGFRVCCFPYNIRGASAGWTRAVAIFES